MCVLMSDAKDLMPGLGMRHLSQEEYEQMKIIGRAASKADSIARVMNRAGDAVAALMADLHRQAAKAEKSLKSATLSDTELFHAITPVFESLMAALEAASKANDNTYLRDSICGNKQDVASRAASMQRTNEEFTSHPQFILTCLLLNIQSLKIASSPANLRKVPQGLEYSQCSCM